jgi:hypothetical protein
LPVLIPTDRRLTMNRNLIAGLFALAILPATAFTAQAAPDLSRFSTKTYQLQCQVNQNDGESLKVRIRVHNTSGHVIPKGTPIHLSIRTRYYNTTKTSEAYRDVQPGAGIPLDQPLKAMSCRASVTMNPLLKRALEKAPRVGQPR